MTAHIIEDGDKSPKQKKQETEIKHPPAEDELGGGDICSLEDSAPTEDDKPLE